VALKPMILPSESVSSLFFWVAFAAMSSSIALCRRSGRSGLRRVFHRPSTTADFAFRL
jgi:hypothetical protein